MRTTASGTSGPIPSPGISVIDVRQCLSTRRRGASSAATASSMFCQAEREAARRSLSRLFRKHAVLPVAAHDGDADLRAVSTLHARYRGSSLTSSTMMVAFSAAAAPQMPLPSGIACEETVPAKGPRTSSFPYRDRCRHSIAGNAFFEQPDGFSIAASGRVVLRSPRGPRPARPCNPSQHVARQHPPT